MESTKNYPKLIFAFVFLFLIISLAAAQNVHLASEIERLERLAQTPGQKVNAYSRMARLYQLSGNREKALEHWMAAAYAEPGGRNDYALLEAVKCMISTGEYDKAAAELRTILISARDLQIRYSAENLFAQLEAFKTGDYGPLSQLVFSGTNGQSILFTLWKISDDDSYRNELLRLFPGSVEAEIARGRTGITAAYTPQWLLFPERNN